MAFIETPRFDTRIALGARGGPAYSTSVVENVGGYESRNVNWANARRKYDVSHIRTQADFDTILHFFHAVAQGRANGFRFKDWGDYQVTVANGVLGTGVGTGAPTVQLNKIYTAGAQTKTRLIAKPVSGTVETYRNAVAIAGESLDTTTGIVTLPALSSATITGITQANPGVVTTSAAHGYSNEEKIYLAGVAGMTQVNGVVFTIAGVTATTFQLGVNTTSYGAYTSGGTAAKYAQPADALTWAGEFDVPVRFDTDELLAGLDDKSASGSLVVTWGSIPLVELRLA